MLVSGKRGQPTFLRRTGMILGSVKVWGLGAMLCTAGWAQGHHDRPSVEHRGEGEMRPHSWIRADRGSTPQGTSPGFFTPLDIQTAYGFSSSGGTGVTIAVVDAYDAPNAEADLGA